MKFKDKDGNVFEDIVKAHAGFCRGRACDACGMNRRWQPKDCVDFTIANPATAARMMGYEVVEDEAGTKAEVNKALCQRCLHGTVCRYREDDEEDECNQYIPKKEDNMDKQKPPTRFDKIKACETPENMVIALNGNERRFCPKSYGAKQPQCKGPCGGCITDWLMEEDKPRFTEEEVEGNDHVHADGDDGGR